MALDHRHLETIGRVLEAIAASEPNTARALVALEDVVTALMLGQQFGYQTPRIAAEHVQAVAILAAEESATGAQLH